MPEAVAVLGLAVGLVDATHIDLDVEFDTLVPFVPCNNASIPPVPHESSDDFPFAVSPFSEHPGVASCPPDTSNFDNPDVNPFEFADSDSD